MTCEPDAWRRYELPTGRTWESFRWLVEDVWSGSEVDEAVTDSPQARDRMVAGARSEGYDVRVTDRRTGEVVVHEPTPASTYSPPD